MASPVLLHYPFGRGLHEENDNRMQEHGTPRALENLVRDKNGRLRARRDYETLGMTGQNFTSGLKLFDLVAFGDRLMAYGCATGTGGPSGLDDANGYIFELVEEPTGPWRRHAPTFMSYASRVRSVGRLPKFAVECTEYDVAAGGGRVCEVFETVIRPDLGSTKVVCVHVFDAESDATLFTEEISGVDRPKVVYCNGSFFVTAVVTASGAIALRRWDPSLTALASLTSPVAAGNPVIAYDLSLSHEETSMWIAVGRTGSTTAIRGLDTAGAVTFTTAGPAVLITAIGISADAIGGSQLAHVSITKDTTGDVDIHTYTPPSTVPVSTLNITATFKATGQVTTMRLSVQSSATDQLVLMYQSTDNLSVPNGNGTQMRWGTMTAATHAGFVLGGTMLGVRLSSKLRLIKSRGYFSVVVTEGEFKTHALMRLNDSQSGTHDPKPVTVVERFLAQAPSAIHLPNLSHDSSVDYSYWIQGVEDIDRSGQPSVKQLRLGSTERRQSIHIGDVLYIAGGFIGAFDGRSLAEAGGFLTRGVIDDTTAGTSVGVLDLNGTYQFTVVPEAIDAKGRLVRGAPSDVVEQALSGTENTITQNIVGTLTLRDNNAGESGVPNSMQPFTSIRSYRTKNTEEGNITFHRDNSTPLVQATMRSFSSVTSSQSDDDLSDNEVLYTQGSRGALSGPLEFVCPDPAIVMAASADRILSAGLPEECRLQESRPLFPGEQVQWSNGIGFYRDVRGRILAVARLDERRILFTASEIFEVDGPGLDDNGIGDIGAPRRLPSDVGLYGGVLGWRSVVEISAGLLFQGLKNQVYLLPRGGVTPIPVGFSIEDTLLEYPDISAAVYSAEDQTVRLCCNNEDGDASVVLLFNVRFTEWFTEGPYEFAIRSAAMADRRFYLLTSANTVLRLREEDEPLSFVPTAWRSGIMHPWKHGMFGRFDAVWFYGGNLGDCRIRARVKFDEEAEEIGEWVDVMDEEAGSQFVHRFQFDQQKCENLTVDFEIVDLQGRATRGLTYNYFAIEGQPSDSVNLVGPEKMT